MKERRFVPAQPDSLRLGDRVRIEVRRTIEHAPIAILKMRAKNAELSARLADGEITPLRARTQYLRFASLVAAHVREHELETRD